MSIFFEEPFSLQTRINSSTSSNLPIESSGTKRAFVDRETRHASAQKKAKYGPSSDAPLPFSCFKSEKKRSRDPDPLPPTKRLKLEKLSLVKEKEPLTHSKSKEKLPSQKLNPYIRLGDPLDRRSQIRKIDRLREDALPIQTSNNPKEKDYRSALMELLSQEQTQPKNAARLLRMPTSSFTKPHAKIFPTPKLKEQKDIQMNEPSSCTSESKKEYKRPRLADEQIEAKESRTKRLKKESLGAESSSSEMLLDWAEFEKALEEINYR